jgi:hypothetical protein
MEQLSACEHMTILQYREMNINQKINVKSYFDGFNNVPIEMTKRLIDWIQSHGQKLYYTYAKPYTWR